MIVLDTSTLVTTSAAALTSGTVVAAVARYLAEKWLRDREEFEKATAIAIRELSVNSGKCHEDTQRMVNALREERRVDLNGVAKTAHAAIVAVDDRAEAGVSSVRERTLVAAGELGVVASTTKANSEQIAALSRKLDEAIVAWGVQASSINLAVKGLTIVIEERIPRAFRAGQS